MIQACGPNILEGDQPQLTRCKTDVSCYLRRSMLRLNASVHAFSFTRCVAVYRTCAAGYLLVLPHVSDCVGGCRGVLNLGSPRISC